MPRTGRSVLGSAASKGRITGGAKSQEGLVMASKTTPTGNIALLICFIPGMKEHIQYIQLITQRILKKQKHLTMLIHVSRPIVQGYMVQLNGSPIRFVLSVTFRFP